jgi:hypothetical protein
MQSTDKTIRMMPILLIFFIWNWLKLSWSQFISDFEKKLCISIESELNVVFICNSIIIVFAKQFCEYTSCTQKIIT